VKAKGKRSISYILPAILFALCSLPAATDPARAQQPRRDPVVRVNTDLVTLDLIATDRTGNHVRDLRVDELQVYDNGKLRKVDFFTVTDEALLSRPLAIVFALDVSGSIKPDETGTLRQAAMKFTELMKGNSVFAALAFNNDIRMIQEFTDDPRKIERAFASLNRFGGSTRIYDALDRAVTLLDRKAPRACRGRPVRRVIVVITDGYDSSSIIDRRELVRRATAAGVSIFSITLPSYMLALTGGGERVITLLDATRIVPATGGKDFAADAADFTPVFRALAEEIRSSYVLSWYPEEHDGKAHELRVASTRPGVQLRASRTTYVAPEN
jgi:Ca-activated chloride channel family protein